MGNLSLRAKLLGALLAVGLLALLVTGWQADHHAETALHDAAISRLTSIRDERKRQIESHLADVRRHGLTLAESRDVTAAMREFVTAYRDFQAEVARWPAQTRVRYRERMDGYYRYSFLSRLLALESDFGGDELRRHLPGDDVTFVLQALFIADNPNPDGARDRLDRPSGGGRYADVHARLNPFLRSIAHQFGYDDLFLIDHETGRVVYTVAKKIDFATSLSSAPHRNTGLARAFEAARTAVDADFVRLVDFESYVPSLGAPAGFVAAPIFKDGRRLGVLALQMSLDRIDAIMTGDRKWQERGLGQTGETYLVGADHRMRSNSRFFLEGPQAYVELLERLGVPPARLRLIETHGSTVPFQEIVTASSQAATSGETGTRTALDYRGRQVLNSYAPLAIPDLRWAIIAKLDTAEAFAPAASLRRALLATAAAVATLVIVGAILLARSLTAPIRRLIAGMETLGHGDLGTRLGETRRDEIGQIATAFNTMAAELQQTTVSRDYVHSILEAMADAVMVVRPPGEGETWRDAVVLTVNRAACAMLGLPADEIVGQPFGRLVRGVASTGAAAPSVGLSAEEVLRLGDAGSREILYKIRDDREIPVLFSSALIREGPNTAQGVVCSAHDLTEIKALEARSAFIRETFGRYVSDDVVAGLLSSPEAPKLGGELRRVTVMMTDLRGFTALAERLSPEDAITFLNGYLHTMVDLILRYRGTINEILGDGILVIFGAPTRADDDAERAVACALAMQLAMDEVNAHNVARGLPAVEMGIGIHTGDVIVGNIGSERRMKYAAVGSPVNLTGRIESYTTGGQILISEDTLREVGPRVTVGRQLRIEPKGASGELTVIEVKGIAGRHALILHATEPAMTRVAPAIPIRYTVLKDKHVEHSVFGGHLTRVSMQGAEIRSAIPVAPLSNVKLWILDPEAAPVELYAKVVERAAVEDGFTIRFTSVGADVARYLERRTATGRPT